MLKYISPRISVMQFKHFGQLVTTGEFRQFDYGADNVKIYGSKISPKYQLANVVAPVHLYGGLEDSTVSTIVR